MQLIKFFRKLCTVSEISTLSKKRLWHRYFHVSFTKFLRTPFLQNNSRRLLLERNIMIPGTKFNSFRSLVRKFTETINSSRSAKKIGAQGIFPLFLSHSSDHGGGDILHILMYKNILDEKASTLLQKATVPHFNTLVDSTLQLLTVKYYRKNTPSYVSYHNAGQNICRLFHVSTQVLFTGSETELNYYYQKVNIEVASQVAERSKAQNMRKLQNFNKISEILGLGGEYPAGLPNCIS